MVFAKNLPKISTLQNLKQLSMLKKIKEEQLPTSFLKKLSHQVIEKQCVFKILYYKINLEEANLELFTKHSI